MYKNGKNKLRMLEMKNENTYRKNGRSFSLLQFGLTTECTATFEEELTLNGLASQ